MGKRLLAIFSLLIISLPILADQTENKPEKSTDNRITLAVAPPHVISEDKADSSLGPVLAAFLIDEMNKSTTFKVIDLEMSDQVEKLLAFANSDKCDQTQCHIAVGNLIPASKLLASTVARLGDKYTMSARLIDIEKGVVEFSAKEQMSGKKDDLDQLTQLVALDLREHLGERVERPKPVAQPQPQAPAPTSVPQAPSYPYSSLESENPLGIRVVSNGRQYCAKVISVEADSPCDFLKPGYSVCAIKPNGVLPKEDSSQDSPYYIKDLEDFKRLVSKIKPGSTVGIYYVPIYGGRSSFVDSVVIPDSPPPK